ncbi:MAG: metal-dependent hydrolase [Pseudomonadota bacterium]
MDNLTHGLTGALMGQMGLKKKTGLGLAALVLGANLPDIDVVGLLWLDSTEALGFRRGITHGPIGVLLLPIGLAALLWGFDRWQDGRGKRPAGRDPVSFKWLYILGLIGAISHSLMDWLNVYGVRFLYPFDKSWYYGDTLFIIDVWLWALLAVSVWWSLIAEKKGGAWENRGLFGMLAALIFVVANYAITFFDYNTGGRFGVPYPDRYISAPVPFAFWKRERIAQLPSDRWISSEWEGNPFGFGYRHSGSIQCKLPDMSEMRKSNSQLDAFLTWSRAPFADGQFDDSVILRDARFYDPLARDRFSLALPDVKCVELAAD